MILASLASNHLKWNSNNGVHCILKCSNMDNKALSDEISLSASSKCWNMCQNGAWPMWTSLRSLKYFLAEV
jgi:hypothetical protein